MLTSDSRQYILNKIKLRTETKRDNKGKIIYRKGEEYLFPFEYFPSLEVVLRKVPDKILMRSNITSVKGLIKKYNQIVEILLEIKLDDIKEKEIIPDTKPIIKRRSKNDNSNSKGDRDKIILKTRPR